MVQIQKQKLIEVSHTLVNPGKKIIIRRRKLKRKYLKRTNKRHIKDSESTTQHHKTLIISISDIYIFDKLIVSYHLISTFKQH